LNKVSAFHTLRSPALFHKKISPSRSHNEGVLGPKKYCAFLSSVFFLVGNRAAAQANAPQLPDGPGKATVQKICSGCHAAEIVLGHRDTKEGWEQIVSRMVDKGANGTDDEFNTIIEYLATYLPKKSEPKATSQ
jgi:cytochrome c5